MGSDFSLFGKEGQGRFEKIISSKMIGVKGIVVIDRIFKW